MKNAARLPSHYPHVALNLKNNVMHITNEDLFKLELISSNRKLLLLNCVCTYTITSYNVQNKKVLGFLGSFLAKKNINLIISFS